MLEFFNRAGQASEAVRVDRNLINERLAAALVDAGIDPDGKIYHSIFKMLSDDLDWYFENLDEQDLV
ncbi:MAG: hypothetical protein ACI97A_002212 [Planctomycetota bacterium]|jgi:hypothetical protein